jgi:hypothetical protein
MVRGGAITNAPFVRPSDFAIAPLAGVLPAGWEVEFYRAGVLVGVTETGPTGSYAFDVPIRYGSNPVEIVAYGPTGEVRRFQQTFEVPFERLAEGAFEYGVAGGACELDPTCEATGNLDLRWGATHQLTLRAGADYFWHDSLPKRLYPYGGAVYQATRALALNAEVVGNAEFGGRVALAPSPNFQASGGHRRFLADSLDRVIGFDDAADLTDAAIFYRPGIAGGRFFVRASASRAVGRTTRTTQGQATLSAQLDVARVDLGARTYQRTSLTSPDTAAGGSLTTYRAVAIAPLGRVLHPLRHTVLRAGFELEPDVGVTRTFGSVSRRLLEYFYLDVGGGWERDNGGFLNVVFKADLTGMRFSSQNAFDPAGGTGVQSAEGSLLLGRTGRPLGFADGRSVGRSGVAGAVFVDLDGDGALDPEEPPVPGARLRVGPWLVEADDAGGYAIWDVVPFEALIVEVDPRSAPDPQWVPAAGRYLVRPDPNRFQPLNIPFVQTAEVTGEVRLLPANTPVAGVEVRFEPEDGSEPYTARSFSDGAFYLMGIRPGRYRVTVSRQVQETYGVVSEDAEFIVEAGRTTVVEGIELRLWKVAAPDR